MELKIEELPAGERKSKCADPAELGFGKYFTDRMLVADWRAGQGWYDARIVPYGLFALAPAAAVFHYGQEIFEGLKAYRQPDGTVALFRPEMNLARFNSSARRLALPEVEAELFLDGLRELVRLEADWVPAAPGTALYIRPALIATEAALGVKAARECRFFIILSPVGAYYPSGFQPIRLLLEDQLVRAAPGGTGAAKTGGNYAASLFAAQEAKKRGFDQVLWLDGLEHRYVEEVGAMNIFFVIAGKLVTPPLSETILGGITRDSLLKLAPTLGLTVEERPLSVAELLAGIRSGQVEEAFGSGTAAVVAPVAALGYREEMFAIGAGTAGQVTGRLYDALSDIQYGRAVDLLGWLRKL
ncbi:MAG: branched-chain amino acid aminotransferase [Desulfobulbaceae bacterium]|nr:branched-chain amino acid aminotransferase [Desulfobulbaceae bacterium]